jgi:hypothetical protein
VIAVFPVALALLAHACGPPSATFELDVPSAVASQAAWYEVGVFPSGCPSGALLLGGIPTQGTLGRLAFPASSASPPGLGDLPNQTYGLAAVARAADCSVIATGCTALGLSSTSTLTISLAAVSGAPLGACSPGTACEEAVCLPSADSSVLGAGCSLALVGAGPLEDPFVPGGTSVSPPAIAATPSGFLIAYREFADGQGGRLTLLPINPSGGVGAPVQQSLDGTCTPTDGVGLAFSGTKGLVAISTPSCGGTTGALSLMSVNAAGHVSGTSSSAGNVTLGQAHALAATPASLLLAYTDQATHATSVATVKNAAIAMSPVPARFGGLAAETEGLIIAADLGAGFLATGTASPDAGMTPDAAATFATEAADAAVSPVPAGYLFPGAWASAGGVGSRIIVATSDPMPGQSIVWYAFDIGSVGPIMSASFGLASKAPVAFADVALHQDHAFFAAQAGHSISLFVFDNASTVPVMLREVPFASLPMIPVGALQNGLVAVAASDTRVAVVWATESTLEPNDAVGGYAVFACTP